MRRFYLHTRNGIFYAELVNPQTGRRISAKSTGTTNRDDALLVVYDWLKNGIPAGTGKKPKEPSEVFTLSSTISALKTLQLSREDAKKITSILKDRGLIVSAVIAGEPGTELFSDFLVRFWTYDKSPFVQDKHAHEQRMGKAHCGESLGRVKLYWIPYFAGKRLGEITRADVKAFSLHLADPALDIKALTRNRILTVGTTALRWAYENDLLPEDPTAGVTAFGGKPQVRGVLTPEEATALFKLDWPDERIKLANLVAMTTGLRAGEIIALKREDVTDAWLHVEHSYSRLDGLKTTKTGIERRAPLLPSVRAALLSLADKNPWGQDGYIFYDNNHPDKPMLQNMLLYGLQDALISLSVGDNADQEAKEKAKAYWKARGVVFHSWRHFYAARMADHALESDFTEVSDVATEVFGKIIPFVKTA